MNHPTIRSADTTDASSPDHSTTVGSIPNQEPEGVTVRRSVSAIWAELRDKWSQGKSARSEEYLTTDFLATHNPDDVLDIIYAEFALAEQFGCRPQIDEYVHRFPAYATAIRQQIEFHAAFDSDDQPGDDDSIDSSSQIASGPKVEFPRRFGRYLLVAPLDAGGQAHVFRAIHPDLGQEIVIKIARIGDESTAQINDGRLQEEARMLASLSHPHLARIFDAGVIDGQSFLALEYIRGQTLSQLGATALPSSTEACRLVAKLARAVSQVHSRGILHLDIKPKNVVLDELGEPRLLDFGLSRRRNAWTEASSEETAVSGTLQFMAPEQALGQTDQIGPATDVFALGGLLYFLLTGRPLYAGKSVGSILVLAQTCSWDREALTSCGASLAIRRACERALNPDSKCRFESAEALASELESCITPKASRIPQRVIMALAVCAMIVLVTAGLLDRNKEMSIVHASIPLELGVEVWNQGRFVSLSNAVPLRNGDELQCTATIPPGMHAAWYLLTSEGQVRELQLYSPELGSRKIRYPDNTLVPLVGPPGTECLLFVIGHEALPTPAEIEASGQTTPEWPSLADHSILRMTATGIVTEQSSRDFGPPSDLPLPEVHVRKKLEDIRRFLVSHGTAFEAVAFSHSR